MHTQACQIRTQHCLCSTHTYHVHKKVASLAPEHLVLSFIKNKDNITWLNARLLVTLSSKHNPLSILHPRVHMDLTQSIGQDTTQLVHCTISQTLPELHDPGVHVAPPPPSKKCIHAVLWLTVQCVTVNSLRLSSNKDAKWSHYVLQNGNTHHHTHTHSTQSCVRVLCPCTSRHQAYRFLFKDITACLARHLSCPYTVSSPALNMRMYVRTYTCTLCTWWFIKVLYA